METKKFIDLTPGKEGLVCLGAGGDLNEWVEGIAQLLKKEGIAEDKELWEETFQLITTGGRVDLVLVFKDYNLFNMGKLALWRLSFGDCSWLSDYKNNYANQHSLTNYEPHEEEEGF